MTVIWNVLLVWLEAPQLTNKRGRNTTRPSYYETFQMHRRTGPLRCNCEADHRCALTTVEDGSILLVMSLTDPS